MDKSITTHKPDFITFTTEQEINNYYNTVSNDIGDDYYYKRIVNHNINHSILGGGIFYLEGVKSNDIFEWQIITSYGFYDKMRKFQRHKVEGVWTDWEDHWYLDSELDGNSSNPLQNKVIAERIYNIERSYVREVNIDIGNVGNEITVDIMNTYLNPNTFPIGGFVVVNIHGTYQHCTTILVNTVANRGGQGQYGRAISISFYNGIKYWVLNAMVWMEA